MSVIQKIGQEFSGFSTFYKTVRRNLKGEKFESEVFILKNFLSPGSVALDIGAAYGRYAFQMSQLVGPNGRIYCFEPGDYSHNVIKKTLWFHRLKNVTLLKKALSDQEGMASMTIPIKKGHKIGPSLAHLSVGKANEGQELTQNSVSMTTIDRFCAEQALTRLDFIKCDVEGAEMMVYRGATQTLDRFKPIVLSEVEADHLKKFNATPADVFNFFFHKGYQAYILRDGVLHQVPQHTDDQNYFFIHKNASQAKHGN